ncbi:hypothetical protein ILUMI_01032 [Ignelater luminosus]|uniref:C2H2-type domain-containing protein n=1 Tax=Ignelater luminosus TaxID=2038154 RepID=A0A8K0GKM9_IGNLU|nr:hypothetical protein ILUMI_01032 [Ignelater luminosus]
MEEFNLKDEYSDLKPQILSQDESFITSTELVLKQEQIKSSVQSADVALKQEQCIIGSPVLQCKYCFKKYKLVGALRSHEKGCAQNKAVLKEEIKNEEVNEIKNAHEANNVKKCNECGQTFKYARTLQKHLLMHKEKGLFSCKICVVSFGSIEEKVIHRMNTHPTKNKKNKCKSCPHLSFSSEGEYLYHINEVHKGRYDDYFMCSECGKQFKTKTELTHHNNSKCGTIRQYKCKECGQELMTAGSLHNHMLRHKGERSSMCGYCGKRFVTAGQLKVHERSHTQEKAFICPECGKGFSYRQSLITHSSIHTGIKPFVCDNCTQEFSCVGNLIKHRKTHADTCGTFPLTTHRVNHPTTKTRIRLNTPKNSKLKAMAREKERQEKLAAYKEKLKLEICVPKNESVTTVVDSSLEQKNEIALVMLNDESINRNDFECEDNKNELVTLLDHKPCMSTNFVELNLGSEYLPLQDENVNESSNSNSDEEHDANGNYQSDNCDDVLNIEQNENEEKTKSLSKVRKKKPDLENGIPKEINNKITKGYCRHCGKMYSNIRWLLKHEEQHVQKIGKTETKSKNSFKCSCCKIGFETRDECKAHQQTAHADILTCHDCDKVFSNVDSLRSHQNIFHKGVPKKIYLYICDKCGMQFRQKAFLTHHEQNNCGSEPIYKCHICGKGFSSVYTRRSHLRIHDPKKRFLCKFCGKNFRWKGQLKIHERSHTGEKPFKCLYCPKAFAYRESLLTHSTIHTGIKPHLCQACGSRFSCIGNLIKHRGTHASSCGVWYSKNQ